MSLQIWLPFNGHYKNQGLLGDVQINNAAPSFINDTEKGSVYSSGSLKISAEQAKILFSPNEFSFACWVKPISASDNNSILFGNDSQKPPNNREFTIYLYPKVLDLHCSWQNESNTDIVGFISIPNFFILNKWTHVAITYKNQTTNIYKNGVLYITKTSNIIKRTQFFETILMSNCSNANLSDYRVYNHCLSPLEIKQLSVGLIGHYPLNDEYITSTKNFCKPTFSAKSETTWGGCTYTSEIVDIMDSKVPSNKGNKIVATFNGSTKRGGWNLYNTRVYVSQGDTYIYSLYIKSTIPINEIDRNLLYIFFFNQESGLITEHGYKYNIINCGNGWYRCWGKVVIPEKCQFVNLYSFDYPSSGVVTYYICAPQFEKSSELTPYTPSIREGSKYCYDISGLTNNIPLSEDINPLFVSDTARYSGSYNFNEVGQTIGTREHIKPTKNVSISAWVKSSRIDTVTEPNVDVDGINIYVNNSGIIHLVGTFGDLNSGISCIDKWTHVCGTYDGTTVKLYINGVLKSSKSYSSDLKYVKGAAISSDSKSGITCKVSDFRIFSTALKDDYITDLYNMGAAVSSGTLATYELNE